MQNDVYDYTSQGSVAKNTVLQKTYRLLGLSFIPAIAGAFFSAKTGFNIFSMFILCCPGRLLRLFLRHDFPD